MTIGWTEEFIMNGKAMEEVADRIVLCRGSRIFDDRVEVFLGKLRYDGRHSGCAGFLGGY